MLGALFDAFVFAEFVEGHLAMFDGHVIGD
jgi:hypothetical protein